MNAIWYSGVKLKSRRLKCASVPDAPHFYPANTGKKLPLHLERQAETELDLALGKGRGEGQRRAWRIRPSAGQRRTWAHPAHAERREPWREAQQRAYLVVHAGVVRPICDVKSLRRKLQVHLFAQFVLPSQARVEIVIVGTKTGVARRADGALICGVIIAIDLSPGEQIEGMPAVVNEDRRQLKS